MEPYLTDRHEAWRAQVRAFAEATIAPVAAAYDASATFPWATVRAMADEGLFGLPWPSAWGGGDWDTFGYLLAVEELARVDASHAITVSAHTTLGTSPIVSFGTLSQRERFVPLLARGRVLAGFGLTEPGAGSDASASRTTAVRGDGGWILNGSKIFITHAGVGEVFVVTAVTDRSRGAHGITSFIVCKPNVETDEAARYGLGHAPELPFTPGVRAGKKEDKLGWRASDTRELLLENAFVPDDQVLGDIGEGFVNFLKTLDAGRIGLAALALGLAQGAFDVAFRYVQERRQFGQRLVDFQGVQFRLADMATDIQAARHLVYHAAWCKEHGRPFTKEASMVKLYATDVAMRVTTQAVQLLGGLGYSQRAPVERMMRDAKICQIGEGTNEIQRLVIARQLLRRASAAQERAATLATVA